MAAAAGGGSTDDSARMRPVADVPDLPAPVTRHGDRPGPASSTTPSHSTPGVAASARTSGSCSAPASRVVDADVVAAVRPVGRGELPPV